MLIRTAREDDAADPLGLLKQLDRETRFMMYEPGERTITGWELEDLLRDVLAGANGMVLVAEDDDRMIGFLEQSPAAVEA